MKLNRLLTAIVVTMLSSGAVCAQKVVTEKGKVFIDASGIDHTTTTKAGDLSSIANNAKVYKKFEVQNDDYYGAVSWPSAGSQCAALLPQGKWRLPTQRELQLIWILTPELVKFGTNIFTPLSKENYWSVTKLFTGSSAAFVLGFNNGATTTTSIKDTNCRFRCIREVQ